MLQIQLYPQEMEILENLAKKIAQDGTYKATHFAGSSVSFGIATRIQSHFLAHIGSQRVKY